MKIIKLLKPTAFTTTLWVDLHFLRQKASRSARQTTHCAAIKHNALFFITVIPVMDIFC